MNRVLTGVIVIMFFLCIGVLNAEQKEIIGKDGASMILIPEGEFLMGSPQEEGFASEHPQHKVFLNAYYIDKYEVTVAQYKKFCEATGRSMPKSTPPWGWNDTHPIVYVTWYDATAYATHYGKRLPTEAEWEKAARAGSETRYCFGDVEADLKNYAWYGDYRQGSTHPVGTKKPNAFGLYDTAGNVWEWCNDWADKNYYKNSPKDNPQGPTSGTGRMLRGGSWPGKSDFCRSAYRGGDVGTPPGPDSCSAFFGFRCASSP